MLNVQTSNLCLPALLTNQTDKITQNCDKTISVRPADPTADYLGNGHWIVTSADPVDIAILCRNGTNVKPPTTLTTVSTLTLVTLDLGCGASCKYFQLPVHFRKDSFLTPYQLQYLNLTLHATDVWENIHSDLRLSNLTLDASLPVLTTSQSKVVSVSLLKAHIQRLRSRAVWHQQVVVPGVSASVCIIAILCVMYCMHRYRCSNVCLSVLPLVCHATRPDPNGSTLDTEGVTQVATDNAPDGGDLSQTDRPKTSPNQTLPWLSDKALSP